MHIWQLVVIKSFARAVMDVCNSLYYMTLLLVRSMDSFVALGNVKESRCLAH